MFQPRTLYGYATFGVEVALFAAGVAVLAISEPWSVLFWVAQLHLGWSMFRFFVIVHECGHRTLFRSARTCAVIGTFASMFCLVPFVPWSRVHRQHHKWVGILDKDPTQELLLQMRTYSELTNWLYRIVWRLWIPVMYFVFIVRVFWGHPIATYRRGDRKGALESFVSTVLCLSPRVALGFALGWEVGLLWTLPMIVAFLFIDENLSLPQHTGLFPFVSSERGQPIPFHAQDAITRTTHRSGVLAVLLSYNFTLHTEHHLFPGVPWYWLPRVQEKIQSVAHYQSVEFWQYMVEIRQRDPRDVYARALPPHARPTREVQLVRDDVKDREAPPLAGPRLGVQP